MKIVHRLILITTLSAVIQLIPACSATIPTPTDTNQFVLLNDGMTAVGVSSALSSSDPIVRMNTPNHGVVRDAAPEGFPDFRIGAPKAQVTEATEVATMFLIGTGLVVLPVAKKLPRGRE